MKYKKGLFILCLLVCALFTISSISASDLAESDMDELTAADDIQVIEENNDEIISESDNGTFQALQDKINNAEGSTITLENDYEYDDFNDGKGIEISRELTIDGKGHKIDGKSASRIFLVKNNAVLKNITFINGHDTRHTFGGAIYNYDASFYEETPSNGNLTIIDCVFKNCTATSGGAICNSMNCSIISCNFTECTGNSGGAINNGGSINIVSCNFTCCESTQHGGAFYATSTSESSISSSNFISCIATRDGGAIYNNEHININGCLFQDCNSKYTYQSSSFGFNTKYGGAIYNTGDDSTISTCQFVNCNSNKGGAVYNEGKNLKISSSEFEECTSSEYRNSDRDGGAVYNTGENMEIVSCNFTECYSLQNGGAIYNTAPGCNISYSIFANNTAENDGGAIYNSGENLTLINTIFENNNATANPDYSSATPVNIINVDEETNDAGTFKDLADEIENANDELSLNKNYTYTNEIDGEYAYGIKIDKPITINGNGITIDANHSARIFDIVSGPVVFKDITFINAKTDSNGGAIHGESTVINCTFLNNSATFGGAIYIGVAINSTFMYNEATYQGGAGFNLNAINCEFINNTANSGGAIRLGNASDCIFINNTGKTFGGAITYVNAFNCNFTNNTSKDGGVGYFGKSTETQLENEFKLIGCIFTDNHGENGGALNGGTAINCKFINNEAEYGGAVYATSIANCLLENNTATDGGAMYNGVATNSTFINNTATNTGGAVWGGKVSKSSLFKNNYDSTGNDIYNTILFNQTLTNHFCDLYDLLNNGEDVISLNGNYTFDLSYDYDFLYGIVINRNVIINGNNFTISGADQARIFQIAPSTNVILKNINFINGKTLGKGGAIKGAATITNCNFINNSAKYGGAIYGNSQVKDCLFLNNSAMSATSYPGYGGAMYFGYANNCTFKYNTANNCGGLYNGTAYNCMFISNKVTAGGGAFRIGNATGCTFINNYAGIYGGGARESIVRNCIFINNTAGWAGGALYAYEAYDCIFINNTSPDGGAVYDTYVYNSIFTGNRAECGGAANKCTLEKCEFTDNYATEYGGAVYFGEISKCSFKNNTADISGNDTYNTIILNVSTKISSSAVITVYNSGTYLIATIKDSYGDPVNGVKMTVVLNGKTYTPTTDAKGQIKIATKGLAPKTYTAKITFNGHTFFIKSTATVKVTVKKATPKITAKKKTFKREVKNKKYTITLKDNNKKPMKKVKLTLKVKGKTYKATTNKKGKATFKIKNFAKKGTFKSKITFKGNKYYNKVTKTVKIKIK